MKNNANHEIQLSKWAEIITTANASGLYTYPILERCFAWILPLNSICLHPLIYGDCCKQVYELVAVVFPRRASFGVGIGGWGIVIPDKPRHKSFTYKDENTVSRMGPCCLAHIVIPVFFINGLFVFQHIKGSRYRRLPCVFFAIYLLTVLLWTEIPVSFCNALFTSLDVAPG